MPPTAMTYKFFAPVLSPQFITAPTGSDNVILYFFPETRPRADISRVVNGVGASQRLQIRTLHASCWETVEMALKARDTPISGKQWYMIRYSRLH